MFFCIHSKKSKHFQHHYRSSMLQILDLIFHFRLNPTAFFLQREFGGRSFAFGKFSNTLLKYSADAGPF